MLILLLRVAHVHMQHGSHGSAPGFAWFACAFEDWILFPHSFSMHNHVYVIDVAENFTEILQKF